MAAHLGETLFESKKGADVTFAVNGEEISAHRVVLSVCCPYFDVMLFGSTNEANMDTIELNETPVKQFKQIIRYCYLRSLEVNDWNEHELLKLLSLAHEYQFDELLNCVELELLGNHINADTIDVVFTYAVRLERANLVQNCLKFLEQHTKEIFQENRFLSYSAVLLSSMLDLDSFKRHNQDEILTKIGKWKANRSNDELKGILKKVNWSRASNGTLVKLVEEFIDKVDCTLLSFWDAIATGPISSTREESIVENSMNSAQSTLSKQQVLPTLATQDTSAACKDPKAGQLSRFSSSTDITGGSERSILSRIELFYLSHVQLKKNVELTFESETGGLTVCLTHNDVRIKFPGRNVLLELLSFEVSVNFSNEIRNVHCNGSTHLIVEEPEQDGLVTFRFRRRNGIKIRADRWLLIVLSRELHNIHLQDLNIRGQII